MKIIKLTKTIALLFLVSIALFSCSSKDDGDPVNPPSIKVKSISLNKTAISKTVGETEQLTATIKPSDATNKNVTWKSSNNEVASVDAEGKLTAKKEGTAVISVSTKDGNKSDECTVKVKATTPYIRMETTSNKVYLLIDAAETDRPDCWIDLNNNSIRDKGEEIILFDDDYETYTPTAEIITIYGKVNVFSCVSSKLTKLDVSHNTKLNLIDCQGNQLNKLDISKNTELINFDCEHNQLTELDLSKNTKLEKLWCGNNKLTKLDVSNNKKLKKLSCSDNQLTELDLSKNTNLEILWSGHNPLNKLDISKNTELINFGCEHNQLTDLDLSKNTKLESLSCSDNQFTKLNISHHAKLKHLSCSRSQLTKLDLSKNTKLEGIYCHDNELLKSLNLANGKNASVVKWVKATGCPNLSCIQIDKGFTPNKNLWEKDSTAQWNNTGNPCK